MTARDPLSSTSAAAASRLAGAGLLALGVVLVALGVVALVSIQLVIDTGGAISLLGAGAVCVALGVLVWRGSRLATGVALALLLCLVLIQVTGLVTASPREPADVARLGLTAVLAMLTALAARPRR